MIWKPVVLGKSDWLQPVLHDMSISFYMEYESVHPGPS